MTINWNYGDVLTFVDHGSFSSQFAEAQMHILEQAVAQLEVLGDRARMSQDSWSAYVIQEAQQIILEVLVASPPSMRSSETRILLVTLYIFKAQTPRRKYRLKIAPSRSSPSPSQAHNLACPKPELVGFVPIELI